MNYIARIVIPSESEGPGGVGGAQPEGAAASRRTPNESEGVGIFPFPSLLEWMRIVRRGLTEPNGPSEVETLSLPQSHLQFLAELSRRLNPATPEVFGNAHALRTLLDRLEEAQIDLSAASSEEKIARIATAALRQRRRKAR